MGAPALTVVKAATVVLVAVALLAVGEVVAVGAAAAEVVAVGAAVGAAVWAAAAVAVVAAYMAVAAAGECSSDGPNSQALRSHRIHHRKILADSRSLRPHRNQGKACCVSNCKCHPANRG